MNENECRSEEGICEYLTLTNGDHNEANDLLEQLFFNDNEPVDQDLFHEIPYQYICEHFQATNMPPRFDEEVYPPLPKQTNAQQSINKTNQGLHASLACQRRDLKDTLSSRPQDKVSPSDPVKGFVRPGNPGCREILSAQNRKSPVGARWVDNKKNGDLRKTFNPNNFIDNFYGIRKTETEKRVGKLDKKRQKPTWRDMTHFTDSKDGLTLDSGQEKICDWLVDEIDEEIENKHEVEDMEEFTQAISSIRRLYLPPKVRIRKPTNKKNRKNDEGEGKRENLHYEVSEMEGEEGKSLRATVSDEKKRAWTYGVVRGVGMKLLVDSGNLALSTLPVAALRRIERKMGRVLPLHVYPRKVQGPTGGKIEILGVLGEPLELRLPGLTRTIEFTPLILRSQQQQHLNLSLHDMSTHGLDLQMRPLETVLTDPVTQERLMLHNRRELMKNIPLSTPVESLCLWINHMWEDKSDLDEDQVMELNAIEQRLSDFIKDGQVIIRSSSGKYSVTSDLTTAWQDSLHTIKERDPKKVHNEKNFQKMKQQALRLRSGETIQMICPQRSVWVPARSQIFVPCKAQVEYGQSYLVEPSKETDVSYGALVVPKVLMSARDPSGLQHIPIINFWDEDIQIYPYNCIAKITLLDENEEIGNPPAVPDEDKLSGFERKLKTPDERLIAPQMEIPLKSQIRGGSLSTPERAKPVRKTVAGKRTNRSNTGDPRVDPVNELDASGRTEEEAMISEFPDSGYQFRTEGGEWVRLSDGRPTKTQSDMKGSIRLTKILEKEPRVTDQTLKEKEKELRQIHKAESQNLTQNGETHQKTKARKTINHKDYLNEQAKNIQPIDGIFHQGQIHEGTTDIDREQIRILNKAQQDKQSGKRYLDELTDKEIRTYLTEKLGLDDNENLKHDPKTKTKLLEILVNNRKAFTPPASDPEFHYVTGHCPLMTYHAELRPEAKHRTFSAKIRPLSKEKDEALGKILRAWTRAGILRKQEIDTPGERSPHSHPIIMVAKKPVNVTGAQPQAYRLAVDMRELNRSVIHHRYHLASVGSHIASLTEGSLFNSFDVDNFFSSIPISEYTSRLCSINTHNHGSYQFRRLPQGFAPSASAASALAARISASVPPGTISVYVDDAISIGRDRWARVDRNGNIIDGRSGLKTGENGTKTGENGAKTGGNGAKTYENETKTGENGAKTGGNGAKTARTGTKMRGNGARPDENGPRTGSDYPDTNKGKSGQPDKTDDSTDHSRVRLRQRVPLSSSQETSEVDLNRSPDDWSGLEDNTRHSSPEWEWKYITAAEDLLHKTDLFLKQIIRFNLKISIPKVALFRSKIDFLGFELSQHRIKMKESLLQSILDFKVPTSIELTRHWLGIVGYFHNLIPFLTKYTAPLFEACTRHNKKLSAPPGETEITTETATPKTNEKTSAKNGPFQLTDFEVNCFFQIKSLFLKSNGVGYPRLDTLEHYPFKLYADWSTHAISAILCQDQVQPDGSIAEILIAATGRKTSAGLKNAGSSVGESFAILHGLQKWKHWLNLDIFEIYSDSVSLKFLASFKNLKGQFFRFFQEMSDFTFKLFFLPGKFNKIADICSRSPNIAMTKSEKSKLGLPTEDDPPQLETNDFVEKTDKTVNAKTASETSANIENDNFGQDLKQHWLPNYVQHMVPISSGRVQKPETPNPMTKMNPTCQGGEHIWGSRKTRGGKNSGGAGEADQPASVRAGGMRMGGPGWTKSRRPTDQISPISLTRTTEERKWPRPVPRIPTTTPNIRHLQQHEQPEQQHEQHEQREQRGQHEQQHEQQHHDNLDSFNKTQIAEYIGTIEEGEIKREELHFLHVKPHLIECSTGLPAQQVCADHQRFKLQEKLVGVACPDWLRMNHCGHNKMYFPAMDTMHQIACIPALPYNTARKILGENRNYFSAISRPEFIKRQKDDPLLKKIVHMVKYGFPDYPSFRLIFPSRHLTQLYHLRESLKLDPDGMLVVERQPGDNTIDRRPLAPYSLVHHIFVIAHMATSSFHSGVEDTCRKIAYRYLVVDLPKLLRFFISGCQTCVITRLNKPNRDRACPQLWPAVKGKEAQVGSHWYIDLTGRLAASPEQMKYACVAVCLVSKYIVAFPLRTKTASEVTQGILLHLLSRYAVDQITSDAGSEFVNVVLRKVTKDLRIHHTFSNIALPRSEICESQGIKPIKRYLRILLRAYATHEQWPLLLGCAVLAHNSKISPHTLLSPNDLMLTRPPSSPLSLWLPVLPQNPKRLQDDDLGKARDKTVQKLRSGNLASYKAHGTFRPIFNGSETDLQMLETLRSQDTVRLLNTPDGSHQGEVSLFSKCLLQAIYIQRIIDHRWNVYVRDNQRLSKASNSLYPLTEDSIGKRVIAYDPRFHVDQGKSRGLSSAWSYGWVLTKVISPIAGIIEGMKGGRHIARRTPIDLLKPDPCFDMVTLPEIKETSYKESGPEEETEEESEPEEETEDEENRKEETDEEGKESEGEEKDVGEQICSILRGKGFNLHQQGQRTGNHMKLPNITKFHLDKESEYELKDISEDLRALTRMSEGQLFIASDIDLNAQVFQIDLDIIPELVAEANALDSRLLYHDLMSLGSYQRTRGAQGDTAKLLREEKEEMVRSPALGEEGKLEEDDEDNKQEYTGSENSARSAECYVAEPAPAGSDKPYHNPVPDSSYTEKLGIAMGQEGDEEDGRGGEEAEAQGGEDTRGGEEEEVREEIEPEHDTSRGSDLGLDVGDKIDQRRNDRDERSEDNRLGRQLTAFGNETIIPFRHNMTPVIRHNMTRTDEGVRPKVRERWVLGRGGGGRERGAPFPFSAPQSTRGARLVGPARDSAAGPVSEPNPDRRVPHMLSRLRDHLKPGRKEK